MSNIAAIMVGLSTGSFRVSRWVTLAYGLAIASTLVKGVHLEIDGTKGNKTLFAVSSFIENNGESL